MVKAVFARLKQLLIEKSWPKLSTGFKNQAGTILGACSAVFRLRRYLQTTTIELRERRNVSLRSTSLLLLHALVVPYSSPTCPRAYGSAANLNTRRTTRHGRAPPTPPRRLRGGLLHWDPPLGTA
jgi:hypothetical protein